MDTIDKIKKSWWVILSFIFFLNGLGFIYIGFKHNNRSWILEGITYELPWFFYFIIYGMYGMPANPTTLIMTFCLILMLVSIIRSVWVAVKLADVYDNAEKYTIKQTVMATPIGGEKNDNSSSNVACCLCLIVIFIIFLVIAL